MKRDGSRMMVKQVIDVPLPPDQLRTALVHQLAEFVPCKADLACPAPHGRRRSVVRNELFEFLET